MSTRNSLSASLGLSLGIYHTLRKGGTSLPPIPFFHLFTLPYELGI